MKSRVYPKYKTKYRVANWPEYERALVQRGDVTLWLFTDAIDAWRPSPSGHPGGEPANGTAPTRARTANRPLEMRGDELAHQVARGLFLKRLQRS